MFSWVVIVAAGEGRVSDKVICFRVYGWGDVGNMCVFVIFVCYRIGRFCLFVLRVKVVLFLGVWLVFGKGGCFRVMIFCDLMI